MRRNTTAIRRLLAGACLAALALAGVAVAQSTSTSITIGKIGPNPDEVTVPWGETLVIQNTDTVVHGITSSHAELRTAAIPPGGTFTTALTTKTRIYRYRQTGGKTQSGVIDVDASGKVTLAPKLAAVLYGKSLKVTGHATIANTPVLLQERLLGDSRWSTLTTLTSGGDGSFSTVVDFARSGRLRATIAAGLIKSSVTGIGVLPRLTIAANPLRPKVGRVVTVRSRVTPAKAASTLTLLGCAARTGRWQRLGDASPNSSGVASFRWTAEYGRTFLRVLASPHSLADGFLPHSSSRLVVTGLGKAPGRPVKAHTAC